MIENEPADFASLAKEVMGGSGKDNTND